MSKNKKLTAEQKRLDADLWIIMLATFVVYGVYAVYSGPLRDYILDGSVPVLPRLLVNAGFQFGLAGLGISIVCLLRCERFSKFGLVRKNAIKSILLTILCFLPYIICVFAFGQFEGYAPFSILVTKDVLAAGLPVAVLGMAIIIIVWGFFEGFNYAVIADKINARYPTKHEWLDIGALVCALVCLLFHPISTSAAGIADMITTFAAIYGMLIVKKKTGCAWGCVFAFCFIWNAI